VGPRAGLDGCGKSRLPPGLDPRTVRPVASRYTNLVIPASVTETRGAQIFHTEDRQLLGVTLQNLVPWATWRLGFMHPDLNRLIFHYVTRLCLQ
jgi:hypothetical protein